MNRARYIAGLQGKGFETTKDVDNPTFRVISDFARALKGNDSDRVVLCGPSGDAWIGYDGFTRLSRSEG